MSFVGGKEGVRTEEGGVCTRNAPISKFHKLLILRMIVSLLTLWGYPSSCWWSSNFYIIQNVKKHTSPTVLAFYVHNMFFF